MPLTALNCALPIVLQKSYAEFQSILSENSSVPKVQKRC